MTEPGTWAERMAADTKLGPPCPECKRRGYHAATCSHFDWHAHAEGTKRRQMITLFYAAKQQDADYRREVWDMGCTCPMLPAHTHRPECPMYRSAQEWNAHLDEEYRDG